MKTILLVVLFGLAACVTTPAQQAQRYSGTLYWSFETSAFRTDDGQGPVVRRNLIPFPDLRLRKPQVLSGMRGS